MSETFLDSARRAVEAGLAHAAEHELQLAIVVVDAAGSVCAAARMDGTRPTTFDVTLAKANTALQFQGATSTLKESIALENKIALGQLFPRIIFIAGGVPIRRDGRIIGAVGVGGAHEDQDGSCAERCVAAFLR